MKKILLSALFISIVFSTFAQTRDTAYTTVAQTSEPFEEARFVDRYGQMFGTQVPAKVLIKWNALAIAPFVTYDDAKRGFSSTPNVRAFDLRVEAKLAPMLSIQAVGAYYRQRETTHLVGGHGLDIRVEPRWYYDMPRRIRDGKSANNLTGNYIGLEGRNLRSDSRYFEYKNQALSLRFGMQRRLWRYGFFDLSYGVGYQSSQYRYVTSGGDPTPYYSYSSVYGEARVALGFALGGRKPAAASSGSVCDVLRCFLDDRNMFKLDLLRALRFDQIAIRTNPTVSYEQKIGQSQFAVELEGELMLNRVLGNFEQSRYVWSYGAGASIQPRYYLLQKRQIARGKSGNNLNGPFIGYAFGYLWTQNDAFNDQSKPVVNERYNAPHLGVQYRLFQNGFIQYKVGAVWRHVKISDFSFGEPAGLYSNLKIGVVF